MKIAINSLLLDPQKAGIGTYIYSLLSQYFKYDLSNKNLDLFLQQRVSDFFGDNKNIRKVYFNINSNKKRIIYEQLLIPYISQRYNYDVIHFTDYQIPLLMSRKGMILTVHDLSFLKEDDIFTKSSSLYKKFVLPSSLKKADRIIAVSENTKKDILKYFPSINENKIVVIYEGTRFDDNKMYKYSSDVLLKYNIKDPYILYVGTIEPRKNIVNIIRAFKIVVAKNPNIKLVIVGKKGWLYDEIFNEVRNLSLENNIIFTGYVSDEDLPAFYKNAILFIYPSKYEGFGLPPLEAMSFGCPVITSNISSLPEVVGDAGILVNPESVEELSDAMDSILLNNNLRNDLSERSLKRAKMFSWDITAKATLKVYEDVFREIGRRKN
ncbi:glycosyltransferase family 4 protein [Thermoanaerobacterium thermosaccharolyticum]|uniref:glycosyltransferase family 4 protein n=1 Tax=Thermoanaerobacterium thermosaccharolyticum TaxID=1517 RepID=UPI00123BC908|nr:glycosyltransferase family 1 protein [Thermoanaerobacterium thermosaccharolyticum]KAA5806376.1 glycosyltransferase family 4 protein [Thermoanaerobacterium thermosaccharolyticum]